MIDMPTYENMMLPILTLVADENEHHIKDVKLALADRLNLTQEQREMTFSEKKKSVLSNRVSWAKTYLFKAGLIENTGWGRFKISPLGLELLRDKPQELTSSCLERFEGFKEFKYGTDDNPKTSMTPDEALDFGYESYNSKVTNELIDRLKKVSPARFEEIVVELLLKMGYGGSDPNAGLVVGGRGDGGIDGIIKEDILGLDLIYIQAKKWTKNKVGPSSIRDFSGALNKNSANKGVFLTTSTFTEAAKEEAEDSNKKVILIDGQELVELMLKYNLGIFTKRVIEIKKIDSDYFDEM